MNDHIQLPTTRFKNKQPKHLNSQARKITKKERKENKYKRKNIPTLEKVDLQEINRRKASGEYLKCAWPLDMKGADQIKDCRRPVMITKGKIEFPKQTEYVSHNYRHNSETVGDKNDISVSKDTSGSGDDSEEDHSEE
jgi:hypothetical protein